MACIIEGCVGVGKPDEKGLCYKCASYKKYRLRAWRLEKARERSVNKRRQASERVAVSAAAQKERREAQNAAVRAKRKSTGMRFGMGKSGARRRGLDWGIPLEVYDSLIKQPCHYCSGELPSTGVGLDRTDNKVGYLTDNVVPCCTRCNRVKGADLSYAEMVVAMQAIRAMKA